MPNTNYIEPVVNKYKRSTGIDQYTKTTIFDPLEVHIRRWALQNGLNLVEVKLSGSRAKGTAISLAADLDMFISLSSTNTATLEGIYNSLYSYFNSPTSPCRRQNASIGVTYGGMKVDLVPGKRQSQYGGDHSLYKRKQNTWTKTNIDEHIRIVQGSNRIIEITAAKVWRERHGLDFPSIFLELVTIEAMKYKETTDHDANFLSLLEYLRDNIQTVRVVDPANTNNIISNDLTATEKKAIADKARESRSQQSWQSILW
ncbi:MAG: hypothetical protein Ta2B_13510 [Termitinemataceae bacterium]|nr:MAG: hypothetical protein Ta2B_13510 [Termitinemataceae bacterium]